MSDKNLQDAIEEIKPILERRDIAGIVLLASPTHTEYLLHPQASWSGMTFDLKSGQLHLKARREDFTTREEHGKAVGVMVGTLLGFMYAMEFTMEQLSNVVKRVAAKCGVIEHKETNEPRERFKIT